MIETFRYRGETLPSDLAAHVQKIDRNLLGKGWKSAVGEIQDVASFEETYANLVQLLIGLTK